MSSLGGQEFEALVGNLLPQVLEGNGWRPEARRRLYGEYEPDFLFRYGFRILAVEAKTTGASAMDFMGRISNKLRQLPEVTDMMVIVPLSEISSDVDSFAAYTGIGIATIEMGSKNLMVRRWGSTLFPKFGMSFSYPQQVSRGDEFAFQLGINNSGNKLMAKLRLSYIASYPFEVPGGKTNFATLESLPPQASFDLLVTAMVKVDSEIGSYPFVIKFERLGADPEYRKMEIAVI